MNRRNRDTVRPKKVVNKEEKKEKPKKKSSSKGFYYSFFTIILLLCLIQITVSAVLNVSKVVAYKAKLSQITATRDAARSLNEQLKDNINNFSNVTGLEAIARNNLKMSSEDEVLVIISDPKGIENPKPRRMSFIKND